MIIDLNTLERSPFEFDLRLAPEAVGLDADEAVLKRPAHLTGELTKGSVQIDVAGRIDAPLEIECARCLQKIDLHLEFPFHAAYVAAEHFTEAKEAELSASELDVAVLEEPALDLAALVREQVLLALPEQVFCREDCRGLCDKCGANRNLIDCRCAAGDIDPRWAALKNLR